MRLNNLSVHPTTSNTSSQGFVDILHYIYHIFQHNSYQIISESVRYNYVCVVWADWKKQALRTNTTTVTLISKERERAHTGEGVNQVVHNQIGNTTSNAIKT